MTKIKCKYCGSRGSFGSCGMAPKIKVVNDRGVVETKRGVHEYEVDDDVDRNSLEYKNRYKICKYCGQSGYGECGKSPILDMENDPTHVHISDNIHCIYCGSTSIGGKCPYSPHGTHQR